MSTVRDEHEVMSQCHRQNRRFAVTVSTDSSTPLEEFVAQFVIFVGVRAERRAVKETTSIDGQNRRIVATV